MQFSGLGISEISDNGPQYGSAQFAKFVSDWHFQHITTSPCNSQSRVLWKSAKTSWESQRMVILTHILPSLAIVKRLREIGWSHHKGCSAGEHAICYPHRICKKSWLTLSKNRLTTTSWKVKHYLSCSLDRLSIWRGPTSLPERKLFARKRLAHVPMWLSRVVEPTDEITDSCEWCHYLIIRLLRNKQLSLCDQCRCQIFT